MIKEDVDFLNSVLGAWISEFGLIISTSDNDAIAGEVKDVYDAQEVTSKTLRVLNIDFDKKNTKKLIAIFNRINEKRILIKFKS